MSIRHYTAEVEMATLSCENQECGWSMSGTKEKIAGWVGSGCPGCSEILRADTSHPSTIPEEGGK